MAPGLAVLLVIGGLGVVPCLAYKDPDIPDIPYCGGRRLQCCSGRQDHCSVQILGTLCYCDTFCNRTINSDCCPDYPQVCLGEPPEQEFRRECYFNGKFHKQGSKIKVNCNECLCQKMSDRMELLCEKDRCLVDPQTIEMVNREQRRFGWTASNYTMFWGRRLSEGIQYRLGTLHSRRKVLSMTPLKQIIDRDALPASFDSRTRWRGLVGPPKDQGWCGSSWVYSTVGVASDRWMIMTKGRMHESLSHQHLLSCNNRNQRGCAGGHLSRAWAFIKKFGLVPESCYPWTGDTTRCNVPKQKSGQDARCVADPQGVERRPLFRMGPVYRVVTEEGIMQEIMSNGPVQATMKVNPDFFMYSGGIYKCSALPGSESGFHSVRIVGWGQEQQGGRPVKYWTVANSWGQDWGEGGFFRIRRGVNECKIEDFVLGAWANLETSRKPTVQEVFLRAAGVRLAALEVSSQSPFDEPYESTTYSNLSNEI